MPEDIEKALTVLVAGIRRQEPALVPFFDRSRPLVAARAPGRLDVMGGIADYSGSTVLQLPLTESAVVFCQWSAEPLVRIVSLAQDSDPVAYRIFSVPLTRFFDTSTGKPNTLDHMRDYFSSLEVNQQWSAYVAGVVSVLMVETDYRFTQGIVIYVSSTVPEGKGVSSSAALEVASMRAVVQLAGIALDGHRQALLCQQVENHVVGAPCGLMDQMTSSLGEEGALLNMLCQPDVVGTPVRIPDKLAVWGIDSGLRHAVSGADYTSVRVAAFMGYRLLLQQAGVADAHIPAAQIKDVRWQGYLANVSVSEFSDCYVKDLPLSMSGQEFLASFDATTDSVTQVRPDVHYAVRACTTHPVQEHFRVRLFAQLLSYCQSGSDLPDVAALLGECMLLSHASYSACGLGSPGTDDLVQRFRRAGARNGIHGARITGGGCGGTVAVLADATAGDLIQSIAADYASSTGIGGHVFSGSSAGASVLSLAPERR